MKLAVLGADSKVGRLVVEKARTVGYETVAVPARSDSEAVLDRINECHAVVVTSDVFVRPDVFSELLNGLQKIDVRRVVFVLQDIWLRWQGVPSEVQAALQHSNKDWTVVCLLPDLIARTKEQYDFYIAKDDIATFLLEQITEVDNLQKVVMLQK